MKRFVSVFPPEFSDTYVKANVFTGQFDSINAINYTKNLQGTSNTTAWMMDLNINQRFHIDIGSEIIIKNIYYENYHNSGIDTNTGIKNFTFWGSNSTSAFAELTYAIDTDWTQLTTDISQMAQHVASDIADPHFITVTNSTAYRYYAFKFADNWGGTNMGIRRIELQQEVDVPEITASSTQNISQIHL